MKKNFLRACKFLTELILDFYNNQLTDLIKTEKRNNRVKINFL